MFSMKGKDASSGRTQNSILELSFAERARTLLYPGRVGSLETHARKQPGFRVRIGDALCVG